MSGEGDNSDPKGERVLEVIDELGWALAVDERQPVTLTADVVDDIFSSIFLVQGALFKMSESISKRHSNDPTYLQSNVSAIDDAKRSLAILKEAHRDLMKSVSKPVGEAPK